MIKTQSCLVKGVRSAAVITVGLLLGLGAAQAQELSGGASGGGAIQGGSGAPGGGVGIPGAIVDGTTATGIGEDDTLGPTAAAPRVAAVEPDASRARAYYPLDRLKASPHHAWRHRRDLFR